MKVNFSRLEIARASQKRRFEERPSSSLLLLYWIPTRNEAPGNGSPCQKKKIRKSFFSKKKKKEGAKREEEEEQQTGQASCVCDEQLHKQQEQNKYRKSTCILPLHTHTHITGACRKEKKGARAPNFSPVGRQRKTCVRVLFLSTESTKDIRTCTLYQI